MSLSNRFQKIIATLLALNIIWLGGFSGVAQAALIKTSDMQKVEQLSYDRQQIIQLINQDEVREKLIAMGVDPDLAKNRVNQMTASELTQLNDQIDQLPAGGGILGLVVLIFVVFVITDVIGATDIFPFIKSVNN
jgi:hypothetical protein